MCLQCTGHINPQLVLWFKMIGMHREEWGGVGGGGSERRYDKELWEKRGSSSQMHIALLSTQPPSLPPHHRPLYFCPLHIPPIASQYSCQFAAPGEDKDGNPHSSVLL